MNRPAFPLIVILMTACVCVAGQQPAAPPGDAGDPGWRMTTFPALEWPASSVPEAERLMREAQDALNRGTRSVQDIHAMLRRAIELDPKHPSAYWRLATALPPLSPESQQLLRRQVEVAPSPQAFLHGGMVYHVAGRDDEAVAFWREGRAQFPQDRQLAGLLGEALVSTRAYADGVAVFEGELAKYPRSSRLHFGFGRALRGLGRNDDAASQFERAIALEDTVEMRALGATELAETGGGLTTARDVVGVAVSRAEAPAMKWAMPEAGRPALSQEVSRLMAAWQAMSWVNYKRGQYDDALAFGRAAFDLGATKLQAYRLGLIQEARKDVPAAAMAYATALIATRTGPSDTQTRLATLIPDSTERARVQAQARTEFDQSHQLAVPHPVTVRTVAAWVAVVDGQGVVRQVVVTHDAGIPAEGDADGAVAALVGRSIGPRTPWNTAVKTIRRGRIVCVVEQAACGALTFPTSPLLADQ